MDIGPLVIIGGKEDKTRTPEILLQFVKLIQKSHRRDAVGVVTTASQLEEQVFRTYQHAFEDIGMVRVEPVIIDSRAEANAPFWYQRVTELGALFFAGGDQLRITSLLGGTVFDMALHQAFREGLIIAGTSAGAAMMSTTMIVEGEQDDIPTKSSVRLATGMGLWQHTVVDQHFTQRGRLGRLLAALAQNPGVLGVGIDEDTAIFVDQDREWLEVWGSQTVSILDGRSIGESNVHSTPLGQPLSITHVTLHVLSKGYGFHLKTRQPMRVEEEDSGEY
ncbi:cyanophycinase [Sulfobacillus thermosulfidooxidans]|uniref:cyanophycinase n=1 Tax=Sulfobacillus thermosulfidooxidans TaxID=28034 RepID=UPI000424EB2E|nr:cyanophycinase [Sulfobacillus thermosulfidooxidans]